MYLSVITISSGFCDTMEMLIPKTIGQAHASYSYSRRLDRNLPVGHRRRGDVGI